MHQLRCILAALFAILIASPACCCAAVMKVEKPTGHSCCGPSNSNSKKEKPHDDCDCVSKAPRMAESQPAAPHAPVFLAPESLPEITFSRASEISAADFSGVPPAIDTGPPRLRLAMLQRFLI